MLTLHPARRAMFLVSLRRLQSSTRAASFRNLPALGCPGSAGPPQGRTVGCDQAVQADATTSAKPSPESCAHGYFPVNVRRTVGKRSSAARLGAGSLHIPAARERYTKGESHAANQHNPPERAANAW
jgi:hypothetical protein